MEVENISPELKAKLTGNYETEVSVDFTKRETLLGYLINIRCVAEDSICLTFPPFMAGKKLYIQNSGKKTLKLAFDSALIDRVLVEPGNTCILKLYPDPFVGPTKYPMKFKA